MFHSFTLSNAFKFNSWSENREYLGMFGSTSVLRKPECGEFSMEGWRGLPTATQATLKGLIPNPLIYYSACVVVTAPSYGHTGRKLKTSSVPYVPTAHSVVAGPSYIHPHGQH